MIAWTSTDRRDNVVNCGHMDDDTVVKGASCRLDQSQAYLGVAFGPSGFHEEVLASHLLRYAFNVKSKSSDTYTSHLLNVLLIPDTHLSETLQPWQPQ
jgi:hypothetical protein